MAVSYILFSLGWWNWIARKEIYRQLKIIEWDKFSDSSGNIIMREYVQRF